VEKSEEYFGENIEAMEHVDRCCTHPLAAQPDASARNGTEVADGAGRNLLACCVIDLRSIVVREQVDPYTRQA
jgi:hypothetical protein